MLWRSRQDPPGSRHRVCQNLIGRKLSFRFERTVRIPKQRGVSEPDGKGFAEAIVGKWKSSSLSDYSFPFFLGKEFEFTKDGRVLENDESKKEWIEKYTYRFDKTELVLTPSGTDKEKRKEQRVKILKITDDELDSLSPRGKLKRIR